MKISSFQRIRRSTVDALAGGEVFFGGMDSTELYMKLSGLPDPDPSTALAVRLSDGQTNGLGKGDEVWTTAAVLEPE